MSGKPHTEEKARRAGRSEANLGQREATLEKASKVQMEHLEGGKAAKSAQEQKRKVSRKSGS